MGNKRREQGREDGKLARARREEKRVSGREFKQTVTCDDNERNVSMEKCERIEKEYKKKQW